MSQPLRPVLGAIAVVCHQDRVILVQRGKPPNAGDWGFPGGHVEWGETAQQAAVRELQEETGVIAEALEYLTNVDLLIHDGEGGITRHYLLTAVLCRYVAGTPVPADDAQQAVWMPVDQLDDSSLPLLDHVAAVARMAQARLRALTP